MLSGIAGCSTTPQEQATTGEPERSKKLEVFEIGGDFPLTDHNGQPFHLAEHQGEAFLIFFGYTFCPDACPQMLSKLSVVYSLLDRKPEQKLTALYISVDPERDTPEALKTYLQYFNSVESVGLTGTPEEIDRVTAQYGATYKKEASTSAAGYLVSHSTSLYLVDQRGRLRYIFRHGDAPEFIADVTEQIWSEP
jgi:protein SCO1/2